MSDTAADTIADLRDRADKLGEAVANLEVFRYLLAELDARTALPQPPLPLSNQQVRAVYAVRAALLRSAIALITAILDTASRDRASLGRVVQIMGEGAAFVANLGPHSSVVKSEKLRVVSDRYPEICRRDDYQRLLQLRHDELGHLLIRDTPTPISERSELHALSEAIKELVADLHDGLGMGPPPHVDWGDQPVSDAKVHWDTFLAGAEALQTPATKTTSKRTAARKTSARTKTPPRKTRAGKTPARKTGVRKAPARKTSASKKTPGRKTGRPRRRT